MYSGLAVQFSRMIGVTQDSQHSQQEPRYNFYFQIKSKV